MGDLRSRKPGYGARGALRNAAAVLALLCLPVAALADEVVIAALGDSLIQGAGLPADDGFVPQLQGWLDAAGEDVRLINAGVSGDTTAGGLARVDWTLTDEVDAMIVTLGGNDFLRGLDPAEARDNLDAILRTAEAREVAVLLIGMEASPNYGPAYKDAFDAIYPDLSERYGTLLFDNFFGPLLDEGGQATEEAFAAWMQPDRIHPNAAGVERIVAAVGPRVQDLIDRVE